MVSVSGSMGRILSHVEDAFSTEQLAGSEGALKATTNGWR
jgi:hypothetical protein